MAALIGFGVPLLFSLIFFFINKSYAPTNKVLLFAALLYVASVGLGIGATIAFGGGAIFAGLVFPILLLIVLSMAVRK